MFDIGKSEGFCCLKKVALPVMSSMSSSLIVLSLKIAILGLVVHVLVVYVLGVARMAAFVLESVLSGKVYHCAVLAMLEL